MSGLPAITDATFDELVLGSELPVLVEFTADWCPPCRMIEPVLREIAAEFEGRLVVAQLDVDANQATAVRYEVMGMPTMNLYARGELGDGEADGGGRGGNRLVAQVIGARSKSALLAAFAAHIGAAV
jgi:thioredoxin 1